MILQHPPQTTRDRRVPRGVAVATTLTLAVVALGCGPIVMIPGGALSGESAPAPTDWSFTDAVDTVQLETRPDDPYSVNIWCAAADGRLYVAGSRSSTWTQNVVDDPRVRLRVDGRLYALRATETTNDTDVDAFVAAVGAKYDVELDEEQRETSILFALAPR